MKKRKTNSALMKRWVFDHANAMMEEFNMKRSDAFMQAYLVRDLLDALGQGIAVFEYEKKDGSLRKAKGTLCKGVSDGYDAYEYKTDSLDNDKYPKLDISYWDLDKEAFRTFSVANVKRIVEVVIKGKSKNKDREFHELIEFI